MVRTAGIATTSTVRHALSIRRAKSCRARSASATSAAPGTGTSNTAANSAENASGCFSQAER
ncbi:MAG: hypothetical protein R2712_12750 [Vicinamibacterales bacterium]